MKKDQVLATIPIKWGKTEIYEIKATEDKELYLENGLRKNKLKYEFNGVDELNYSIKRGTKLGTITVTYRNEELTTYDVYLNDALEYYHPVLYVMIAIAIILMIISLRMMIKQKKKDKKNKSNKKTIKKKK